MSVLETKINYNIKLMAQMLASDDYNRKEFDKLMADTVELQRLAVPVKEIDEEDDMEGERNFMREEAKHRDMSEDERIIYNS